MVRKKRKGPNRVVTELPHLEPGTEVELAVSHPHGTPLVRGRKYQVLKQTAICVELLSDIYLVRYNPNIEWKYPENWPPLTSLVGAPFLVNRRFVVGPADPDASKFIKERA